MSEPRRFLAAFAAVVVVAMIGLVGVHLALARMAILPPPPFVGTPCIDSKFDFLIESDLAPTTLLAVGSSATWRNLDMRAFEAGLGETPINAAPCYLHIDQTLELASFLAPRMPQLGHILVVTHPRDFKRCPITERSFFDRRFAGAIIDGRAPKWLAYVVGLKPLYLASEARAIQGSLGDHRYSSVEDGLGSSTLTDLVDWEPELRFDPDCFEALAGLEALADAHDAQLTLVFQPIKPDWEAREDPTGERITHWVETVRAELGPNVRVVDARGLAFPSDWFADPVHLLDPHQHKLTDFIVQEMAKPHAAASDAEI